MTPRFALDLAHDGIRLLFRADGGWTVVGDVALDDPAMTDRLAALRDEAERIAPGQVTTELIIPPSQILYTEMPITRGERLTEATIRPRLDGVTPLDPDELEFDWAPEGDRLRLAVLEKRTLREAEDFAQARGFRPVAFSARPTAAQFPRAPDFGATSMASDFLDPEPQARPAFASRRPATPGPVIPATTLRLTEAERADPGTLALARNLAERPSHPKDRPPGLARPGAGDTAATLLSDPRALLALAAALVLAGLIWAAYFLIRPDGPSDPAAALSEVPPAVASVAPELAEPREDPRPDATSAEAPAPEAALAPPAPLPEKVGEPAGPGLAAERTEPPRLMTGDNPALRYAATGIWLEGPASTSAPAPTSAEEIYTASIDPVIRSADAIALIAPASPGSEPRPPAELGPPPADTAFDLDEEGLVRATPEGAVTPQGILVRTGRPALVPPERPDRAEEAAPPLLAQSDLPDTRPRARPRGLVERNERASLGGRTRTELAGIRPEPRPRSAQSEAVPAAPTELAVTASLVPRTRPEGLAARIATDRAVAAALAPEEEDEPEAAPSAQPDIPTSASVARQATIENAIRLRQINLIGVYGTEGDRRALVRLASGKYVKVQVGDRLDGGRIAAIGRDRLQYVKGGRNIVLEIPSG